MNSKKKLITALSMFALVVVVAAASVGITLAALSGSVGSSFTIKYNALNVNATVSAKYTVLNASAAVDLKTDPGDETSITFNAGDGTATGTFKNPGTIELTNKDNSVTFAYTFTNKDTTNDLLIKLGAELSSTSKNLTIAYSTDNSDWATTTGASLTSTGVRVAKGGTTSTTIYIKFSITTNTTNIAGDTFNVTWNLSGVTAAA